MKKYISIILACLIALSLAASINVENSDQLTNVVFGRTALVEIGDGLWYDSTTRIVYWWNGHMNIVNSATTPSPYYAPNGLPYRYNPETNTFEEIN